MDGISLLKSRVSRELEGPLKMIREWPIAFSGPCGIYDSNKAETATIKGGLEL